MDSSIDVRQPDRQRASSRLQNPASHRTLVSDSEYLKETALIVQDVSESHAESFSGCLFVSESERGDSRNTTNQHMSSRASKTSRESELCEYECGH